MICTYNKGILTIKDDTREYAYNINTNELINTKTKRQVKSVPMTKNEILHSLDNGTLMMQVFYSNLNDYSKEYLFSQGKAYQVYDKFASIVPDKVKLRNLDTVRNFVNNPPRLKRALQLVSKKVQDGAKSIDLYDIIIQIEREELFSKYPNVPTEIITKRTNLFERYANSPYKDIFVYYFITQRGYLASNMNGLYMSTMIDEYLQHCQIMNKEPIKTSNFLREAIETHVAYENWLKLEKETRWTSIKERYAPRVEFETDDFIVMLPPTAQDLVREGNEMHHCVGGYVDGVANGETLIVYIRKKSEPNKSYITAQINPKDMKLGQYYLAYDRHISEPKDIEFKELYQQFLYGNI